MKIICWLATAILSLSIAHAQAAFFTETQPQTIDGQDFVFNFAPAPLSNGGPGALTVRIRGDFTIGASLAESYDLSVEGLFTANDIQATNANLITSFGFNDNLFEETFVIPGLSLLAITADGAIGTLVDYASGVNANLSADPFITLSLRYDNVGAAVPEPGSLALVGIALGAFGLSRRRKKT